MRKRKRDKVFVKGLKCPDCNARKLSPSGDAAGAKLIPRKRYHCNNCGLYTIYPDKIVKK